MTRESISRSLESLKTSFEELEARKDEFDKGSSLLRANAMIVSHFSEKARNEGQEIDQRAVDMAAVVTSLFEAQDRTFEEAKTKLANAKAAAEMDVALREEARQAYLDVIGAMQAPRGAVPTLPVGMTPNAAATVVNQHVADVRAFTPATLLSVAGHAVLETQKAARSTKSGKISRYDERLETTLNAFLDVVGDKPLNYYLPIHLQDFATVLARVPANRSKFPIFKGLTLREMGEKNSKLSPTLRKTCLSSTSISGYLLEIKSIWKKITAGMYDVRDITNYSVTMPADAEDSIDREPLKVSSLNIWIRDIASESRMRKPHKAWLPVVGLLTGMRLAELVYLQKTDIVDVEGNEVFDLRRPLRIGGKEIDRPLKTKTSKRIVAIHPILRECGFIDYAKKIRSSNGFIFSHFQETNDPPDAAQKQMGNWMKTLGIHERQRQVFHSLRHNAKHWFRVNAGDRLADLQCGHALDSEGKKYGFKSLDPEEVQKIMAIPPLRNVDFSPLIERAGRV
ncbi:hypothetical protein ACWKW5_22465 [Shinella zoogloeoides]